MIPSRRHRSFTVTSRRKPSRTTRIFSSGVYLRRVAALTRRTKDLVCSVRSSAASGLPTDDWVTSAPFSGNSTLCPGARTTLPLSDSPALRCVPFSLTIYNYPSALYMIGCLGLDIGVVDQSTFGALPSSRQAWRSRSMLDSWVCPPIG